MELNKLLEKIDEINDSYEDIFNARLHELTDEESERLTVKEFLSSILEE